ncbi:MAG: polysulfide reductase NrfD [Nitrospirae bacterium]|nr:polysulfide reductase NrfD [Nitrospirota bacterium]
MTLLNMNLPDITDIKKTVNDIFKGKGGVVLYLSVIGILMGIYAFLRLVIEGHGAVTNTSSLVPWGVQISTYVYMVLLSTGCTFINFFGYMFYRKQYEMFGTRILFIGIFIAFAGMGALATELGRMDKMIYFLLSPQPKSPMWWMSVWYSIYVTLKLIELVNHKRGTHSDKLLWATFIVAIITYSNLGSVFGIIEQRAYYFGSLLPIYFLMLGFLTGAALATIIASAHFYKSDTEFQKHVQPFRNSLRIGLGIAMLATFWRLLAGLYAQSEGYEIFQINFMYSFFFELILSLAVPLIITYFSTCQRCMIVISLFVLATQFKTRTDLIVGGFKVPVFKAYTIPDIVSYIPSHVEMFVVIGALSAATFIYIFADKIGFFKGEEHIHG